MDEPFPQAVRVAAESDTTGRQAQRADGTPILRRDADQGKVSPEISPLGGRRLATFGFLIRPPSGRGSPLHHMVIVGTFCPASERSGWLPYFEFLWTDDMIDQIAEHGLSQEDFEEAVCDPVSTETSRSSGKPMAFGSTSDGRFVACVYEIIDELTLLPVAAYEVDE
ncbi:MAG: hypothetical protein ACREIV_03715 [Planctomycetaceae bacterium]